MITADMAIPRDLPKTYAELVALHVPRPIHDDVAYENTVTIIDALAGRKLTKDQADFLDLLTQLVETYDDKNVPPPQEHRGIELVRCLLEQNEMTAEEFGALLGVERSVAYKILKGRRNLTTEHVRKLAERFRVSADALLG